MPMTYRNRYSWHWPHPQIYFNKNKKAPNHFRKYCFAKYQNPPNRQFGKDMCRTNLEIRLIISWKYWTWDQYLQNAWHVFCICQRNWRNLNNWNLFWFQIKEILTPAFSDSHPCITPPFGDTSIPKQAKRKLIFHVTLIMNYYKPCFLME